MKSFGHHEDYALLSRLRRGENQSPWTKTSCVRERTNNKLNAHMALMPGFQRRPHWWVASALTIVPPLLSQHSNRSATQLL